MNRFLPSILAGAFLLFAPGRMLAEGPRNLGFERGAGTPAQWSIAGEGFRGTLDTSMRIEGQSSLRLECLKPGNDGVAQQSFSAQEYRGRTLRLTGFIRTENVTDGFASLWLRIDGPQGPLYLDNMQNRGLTG